MADRKSGNWKAINASCQDLDRGFQVQVQDRSQIDFIVCLASGELNGKCQMAALLWVQMDICTCVYELFVCVWTVYLG